MESPCILGRVVKGYEDKNLTVVFTGALDELFNFQYGRLSYCSLRFEWKHEDINSLQEAPVVAYPQEPGYTRITEYKKVVMSRNKGNILRCRVPFALQRRQAD